MSKYEYDNLKGLLRSLEKKILFLERRLNTLENDIIKLIERISES